jgi:glycosyltransferase involved in cell wall biosynthesis
MRELRKEKRIDCGKVLAVIPAHNEAFNLPVVVGEIRSFSRAIDVLVVDDGSTDETAAIMPLLGVKWLELPRRMGIGAAMRVALRYAVTHGYAAVVRLDGDGQHLPTDISRLLAPIGAGVADVAMGARELRSDEGKLGLWLRRGLAAGLTAVTGRTVTDPTCGFYALGPKAIRILAEHHPTGYPEAELRLFLNRNRLRMLEVPVAARSRLSGQTSLTPARLILAAARVVLAMCVVPLRRAVPDLAHD